MLLFCVMARLGRVVVVNVPHHLTHRGNARRFVLDCDADRAVFLKLLRENTELYKVSLIGYCLMSNHIHLIAIPRLGDGLALALKNAHGRYAAYWNALTAPVGTRGKEGFTLVRWTSPICGKRCATPNLIQ
jgi:REP element-mobilizing transposase RayT